MDWKDKVVWITGASSGIGKELVIQLASKGARIILSARNSDRLQEVCTSVGLTETNSHIHTMDLSKYHQINDDIEEVLQKFGRVDVLINNAGITQRAFASETELEVDEHLMNINYFGPVALTKGLLPHFKERGSGIVAVTSSVAGKIGTPLRTAYCASKHALHGFFESMRAEVHDQNIQVTIVCPGFIQTDISMHAMAGDGSQYGKMDDGISNGMTVEKCVNQYIKAIEQGKEEVIISQSKEKFAVLLNRFYPSQLRKLIRRSTVT